MNSSAAIFSHNKDDLQKILKEINACQFLKETTN